jgi:hypothetical protein
MILTGKKLKDSDERGPGFILSTKKSRTYIPSGVVLKLLSFFFFNSGNNNEVLTSRQCKGILYILIGRALELAMCTKPETAWYQNFNSI